MSTQWRVAVGMSGGIYVGLDYGALREVWQGLSVRLKDRPDIFTGLRVMESAALKILNERK